MNPRPEPPYPAAAQRLRDLAGSERRVQLLALLPLINALQIKGDGYSALAEVLAKEGLVLKPESLRKALFRWRLRQKDLSEDDRPSDVNANSAEAHARPIRQSAHQGPPASSIFSKADLKQLRNSPDHIDLNELAEIGRQK